MTAIATEENICSVKWASGNIIFATDQGKIDQPWQVLFTELPQNIESPLLYPLLEFQEKFPPINMCCLKSWYNYGILYAFCWTKILTLIKKKRHWNQKSHRCF